MRYRHKPVIVEASKLVEEEVIAVPLPDGTFVERKYKVGDYKVLFEKNTSYYESDVFNKLFELIVEPTFSKTSH